MSAVSRIAAVCLAVAAFIAAGPPASALPSGDAGSQVPGYPDVIAEYIQVPGGKAPGTPAALRTGKDRVDTDASGLIGAIAAVPVYVVRQGFIQGVSGNPFPGVKDYAEVNKTGTSQTPEAKAISPLDPAISAAICFHTDFVGADDSLAGQGRPGEPGVSAVSGTLVDWVLKRARGLADTPSSASLGVRARC